MKEIKLIDFMCQKQIDNFIKAFQSGNVGTEVLQHLKECPECQVLAEKGIEKIPFPTKIIVHNFYNKFIEG